MDFKKIKNEKGITLIALAVTIVVLLILAGVTISSVFSENGIINKALQAQNAIDKAQANDLLAINHLEEQLDAYYGENINEEEYATLNLKTFFGRHYKQQCDYLRMNIEISNQEDKVTFAVGTDWKENIKIESKNKLFSTKYVDMKLLQDLTVDKTNVNDNSKIGEEMVNAFTHVAMSNLKLKKGNIYNIKLTIQAATYKNDVVTPLIREVYSCQTEQITEDILDFEIQYNEMQQYRTVYDVDGDGAVVVFDGDCIRNIVTSTKIALPMYTVQGLKRENYVCRPLFNQEGEIINEDYIGLDINRDGYITEEEGIFIMNVAGSFGDII